MGNKIKENKRLEYSSVSLPKPLYNKIKGLIAGTGFRSVSEYTIFILRESFSAWMAEEEQNKGGLKKKSKSVEQIKHKLEALGYI